jgi:aryl-alcohol dehydrogenase-like predicted oxidoreductase
METRRFGKTDLQVSVIGFGAWAIGGPAMAGNTPIGWGSVDDATSLRALRRAYDLGITFFDTADFYGLGHSEELLGEAFAAHADVFIASKVGHRLGSQAEIVLDYSRAHIISACEASLRRLRRDRIDYYQLHSAKVQHLEQGECLEAMFSLQKAGKIRYWGISLNTFAPTAEAEFLMDRNIGGGFQLVLNIINQRSLPLIKRAAERGYGIIARMPLQFGLLTGRFDGATRFDPTDHRSFRLTPALLGEAEERLAQVRELSSRLGISQAELALRFCVGCAGVTTVIPGIRTPEQAAENARCSLPLPADVQLQLEGWYERQFSPLVEMMAALG